MTWPSSGCVIIAGPGGTVALEIGEMGGRMIALRQRMQKIEEPDEWTEIAVITVEYELELEDSPLHHAPHTAEDVTADEWGLVTVRQLTVTKGGNRILIKRK